MDSEDNDVVQVINAGFPPKLIGPLTATSRYLILHGGRGGGKDMHLSTLIPTPEGWVRMGDICVGDRVFDELGQPTMVTHIHETDPKIAYRLTFSDGAFVDCSATHEWVTWTHADRKSFLRSPHDSSRFPDNWVQWRRIGKQFSDKGPRSRTTQQIVDTLVYGKRGDFNHCIPLARPLELPVIDLPIEPYVLGYWLGNGAERDGYITTGSHQEDFDHPHIGEQYELAGYPVELLKSGVWKSSRLIAELRSNGLLGNKHLPKAYLRSSIAQRISLLQGLMDSDGTCDRQKGLPSFSNTDESLARAVFELVVSLGQKPTLIEDRAIFNGVDCGPCFQVSWRASFNPFSLPRKAKLIKSLGAQALRSQHRMIISAERIPAEPMRCITVDSPNHLYLCTEWMIPTHNSWATARYLLLLAVEQQLRILCAREFMSSVSNSVHKLLNDQIHALGLSNEYTIEQSGIYSKNGSEFRFAGIRNNVSAIKSFEGIDICWVEEAENVSKNSWVTLINTIRKKGSRIIVTFNPALETDDTYQRFIINRPPSTIVTQINYDENPWFHLTELPAEMEYMKETDYDAYRNVWLGEPVQHLDNAIFGKEIRLALEEERFTKVPYDPIHPVHTFFDIGWNDETAVIFAQIIANRIHIIDFLHGSHLNATDVVHLMGKKPYEYGTMYLPHDAESKHGTGMSYAEIMRSLKQKVLIVPRPPTKEDGIHAGRITFSRVWIDKGKCEDLINCLKKYCYQLSNQKRNASPEEQQNAKWIPVHNDASHAADAYIYLAMSLKAPRAKSQPVQNKHRFQLEAGWMR